MLVGKVLLGDRDAFKTIIKSTEALTAQIIFKMVANASDRRDLAQDVYLNVFQGLGSFQFKSKLSTWIARIAYNTCLNYLRKNKLVLVDNHQYLPPCREPVDDDASRLLYSRELSVILKAGIDKLPPLYKTLVTLYHTENLTYAEITQITGLPEGTLKSYLFRARKTLKDTILLTYKREAL